MPAQQGVVTFANGRFLVDGQPVSNSRDDPNAYSRMYGTAGYLGGVTAGNPVLPQNYGASGDYFESASNSVEGGGTEVRVRQDVLDRLHGRVQLPQVGIGGPGGNQGYNEVIDPTRVQWDPEFGLVTTPDNIKGPDPREQRYQDTVTAAAMAAFGGIALGAAGGAAGEAAGSTGLSVTATGQLGVGAGADLTGAVTGLGAYGATGAVGETALLDATGNAAGTIPGDLPLNPGPVAGTPLVDAPEVVGANSGTTLGDIYRGASNVRRGFSLGRNLLGLAGQGQRGGRMPDGNTGQFDIGNFIASILSMGALGRQGGLWGNHGPGTPGGAQAVGDRASAMADPWGTSGRRQQFNDILTPDYVQSMLNPDPRQIASDPNYRFIVEQGTNAINVGDAAQGTLRSGNRGYELQQFGQNTARSFIDDIRSNNRADLQLLGRFGGVDSSSPTAAAAAQIGAFENATTLQNNGLNGFLGNMLGRSGNPLAAFLSQGTAGIMQLYNSIFGDNTVVVNPGDYMTYGSPVDGIPLDTGGPLGDLGDLGFGP